MVDSDDELLARVDTLVQESRAPMYTTVAPALAQKENEVVEETTVTPLLVLMRHNSPRTTPITSPNL
jgi:hypothetical protein